MGENDQVSIYGYALENWTGMKVFALKCIIINQCLIYHTCTCIHHLSQKDLNLLGEAGTNFNSNFDGSLPYKNVKRKGGHFLRTIPLK